MNSRYCNISEKDTIRKQKRCPASGSVAHVPPAWLLLGACLRDLGDAWEPLEVSAGVGAEAGHVVRGLEARLPRPQLGRVGVLRPAVTGAEAGVLGEAHGRPRSCLGQAHRRPHHPLWRQQRGLGVGDGVDSLRGGEAAVGPPVAAAGGLVPVHAVAVPPRGGRGHQRGLGGGGELRLVSVLGRDLVLGSPVPTLRLHPLLLGPDLPGGRGGERGRDQQRHQLGDGRTQVVAQSLLELAATTSPSPPTA